MVEDFATRLAAAVEHASKVRGSRVSCRDLAAELGVSYQATKKWFDGRSKSMTADNTRKAAKFLGVNHEWLASGVGQMLDQAGWADPTGPTTRFGTPSAFQASPTWPFPLVNEVRWTALNPEERAFVQFKLEAVLDEIERKRALPPSSAPAAVAQTKRPKHRA